MWHLLKIARYFAIFHKLKSVCLQQSTWLGDDYQQSLMDTPTLIETPLHFARHETARPLLLFCCQKQILLTFPLWSPDQGGGLQGGGLGTSKRKRYYSAVFALPDLLPEESKVS